MMATFDIQAIRQTGWRQGIVCSVTTSKELCGNNPGWAIILTHDCDIVCSDLSKEPHVEILVALEISTIDGNYVLGKNSRCYHFEFQGRAYEIKACDRKVYPRSKLIEWSIHPVHLPDEEIRAIVHWFAQRYERPAFPDNFIKRIDKKTEHKIKTALKDGGSNISGLYVSCPKGELPDTVSYDILLRIVMPVENFIDVEKFEKCNTLSKKIVDAFNLSAGISIINAKEKICISEDDMTLDDLRRYKRYALFDHFSFDSGIEPLIS